MMEEPFFMEDQFATRTFSESAVLVAASLLKTHALAHSAQPASNLSAFWELAVIVSEMTIGLALCLGLAVLHSCAIAAALFILFAAYNAVLLVGGNQTCPCFGTIGFGPGFTLLLDVVCGVVVSAGYVAAMNCREPASTRPAAQQFLHVIAMSIGVVCISWVLLWSFNSLGWTSAFNGEAIRVVRGMDLDSVAPGESKTVEITLENRSNRPVRIIGAYLSCACDPLSSLPVTIQGRQSRCISVRMAVPPRIGRFSIPFELYTDADSQPVVYSELTGISVPHNP
jgi:hypothetical protein